MLAPGRRGAGFTLLELLIALTLVSLILVQLFGGLRLASRAWDGVEQHAVRVEGLRLAGGFLRRLLMQAQGVVWPVGGRSSLLFWGNESEMEFVTPLSQFIGQGGMYLVRVARVEREGHADLVLQRWLLHPDVLAGGARVPTWEPMQPVASDVEEGDAGQGVFGTHLLASDVGEVRFSYFGPDGERQRGREQQTAWSPQWQERNQLPLLVKIEFGDEAQWPAIVVRLTGE